MKKRILAGFLSLALVFSLLPVSVLAEEPQDTESSAVTEVPVAPSEEDPVCAGLPGCGGEAHDPECPLYMAPEGPEEEPDAENPVCTGLPGCGGGTHDPECPLYKAPDGPEEGPDVGAPVCTGLPGCEGETHDPECPLYTVPVEPPMVEPEGLTAYRVPAEGTVIYVSQYGGEDGGTADKPTSFTAAMEQAKDGDVFAIVGTVTMENWTTPQADITIRGADENAELKFSGHYNAPDVWLSLRGDLTVENLTVAFSKQRYIPENGGPGLPTFIFANGHTLHLTETAAISTPEWKETPSSSSSRMVKSQLYIFGGGDRKDNVAGDTHLILEMSLKNEESIVYVYGGGRCSNVSGSTNVELKGENVHVRSVVGGGLVDTDGGIANVVGNTSITVSGGAWAGDIRTSSSDPDTIAIAGGGHIMADDPSIIGSNSDIMTATANVSGTVTLTLNGIIGDQVDCIVGGCYDAGKSFATQITGWTGPVVIDVDDCQFTNQFHRIFGGGHVSYGADNRDIKVQGDVTITVDNSSVEFVYGGGRGLTEALPLVTGNVNMTLTDSVGGNSNGVYMNQGIYVSGWNENCPEENYNMVLGKATLTLNDFHGHYIHANGHGAGTAGAVEIFVNGGGSTENNDEYIHNSDASYGINSRHPNATLHINGDVPITQLRGFQKIKITEGSTLRQYDPEQKLLDKHFGVLNETINLAENARLELTGSNNEISGAFDMGENSTLYIAGTNYFTVGGKVTTTDGATFATDENGSETGYARPICDGRVFLYSQTKHDVGSASFDFPQGKDVRPQLTAEDSTAVLLGKHQWKLAAKPFTLKPLELTKYMAGDHDHEKDENCFPDPRFEGIDEDTVIQVAGEAWDKDVHKGQYPFQIMYYPLPDNYDLKDFPNGITDTDLKVPLADDHKAGTYIAKVEPNDGIKLTNITIDGSAVKTALSLLHIREVEKVDQVGDDIGKLASPVTGTAPTQKVTEAVAVMPEGMTYLVNNLEGQALNPNPDVRLLHDELLTEPGQDTYTNALIERLEREGVIQDSARRYAMKYLDLIDANDSNLLVCAQSEYQIYVPYPAGTDQSTEFALYHFGGLNRTYTEQDYGENVFTNIENSTVSLIQSENKSEGIVFTVYPPVKDRNNYSIGAMALTWKQKQHTVAFDSNGGTQVPNQTVTDGQTASEPAAPTRSGYDFEGWYLGDEKYDFSTPVTSSITLTAYWSKHGGGGGGDSGGSDDYILRYDSNGGTRYHDELYRRNTVVKLDKTPERRGYTFTGWYADRKLTDRITSIKMTGDKTVYAGWRHDYTPEDLNSKDHVAYVAGYPDGTVRPDSPVTRAETATMLYRLLTDARRNEIDTEANRFSDVSSADWFVRPVSTMANGGYIAGYPDGTFGGNRQITRAEFVTMLVRFIGLQDQECSFPDVPREHWAYDFIATATEAGWIAGYTDGSFGPDRTITRAEAMTILNSVLNRGVNEKSELLNFKVWPDNPKTAWYYYEVIEASNGHEYTGSRPSEDWTSLVKDLL